MELPLYIWEDRKKSEIQMLKEAGFKFESINNNETLKITIIADGWEPPNALGKYPRKRNAHQFQIDLPREYPYITPSLKWLTPIFHPNISPPSPLGDGHICIGTLQTNSFGNLLELVKGIVILVGKPNVLETPIYHPLCQEAKQYFIDHPELLKTEDEIKIDEIISY